MAAQKKSPENTGDGGNRDGGSRDDGSRDGGSRDDDSRDDGRCSRCNAKCSCSCCAEHRQPQPCSGANTSGCSCPPACSISPCGCSIQPRTCQAAGMSAPSTGADLSADDACRPLDYGDHAVTCPLSDHGTGAECSSPEASQSMAVNVTVDVAVSTDQSADVSSQLRDHDAASSVGPRSPRSVDVAVGTDRFSSVAVGSDEPAELDGDWASVHGEAESVTSELPPPPHWITRFTIS